MVNYREILRLHSLNYSHREIAASVHSSRSTIQQVLNLASALKIRWSLPPETTNTVLESLLYPERVNRATARILPDFSKIHDIFDTITGEAVPAYLYVGILSCSGYIYAELCRVYRASCNSREDSTTREASHPENRGQCHLNAPRSR